MRIQRALIAALAVIVAFRGPDAVAQQAQRQMDAITLQVPVDNTSLFARTVGSGRAVIVLHGGPDFDQAYLLPDLDKLKDGYRLIYYDQRGRGRSAKGVKPEDVTLASDLSDLDAVRRHFQLDAPILLGHSWGAVLALEYALRNPLRVSALVLMNPAPVSVNDLSSFRAQYLQQLGADNDQQQAIKVSRGYRSADPDTVALRYRIHFKHALARPADYEKLMDRMRAAFIEQGSVGILKAWAVEDRLYRDTWARPGYDLLSKLPGLRVPTFVITGDRDFIPVFVAQHIAQAIPGARLSTLPGCGHFTYLECPRETRRALDEFFSSVNRPR